MALPLAAISLIISVVSKIVGLRRAKKDKTVETLTTKEIQMDEKKSWYESKTIWGVLITGLSFVSVWVWGTSFTEDEKAVLVDSLTVFAGSAGVLFGSVLAIYGRIKASKTLK